jgi:hypothetical protein
MLASHRVAPSPSNLENAHEPSGHSIPGCSSKSLLLCPAYNKWTSPCNRINIPMAISAWNSSALFFPLPAALSVTEGLGQSHSGMW